MAALTRSRCVKCGACTVACPLFQITGRESQTSRGKLHLIARLLPADGSRTLANILSQCLLCGACVDRCPRSLAVPRLLAEARAELAVKAGEHAFLRHATRLALSHPFLLKTAAALGRRLPAESGLRLRLGLPFPGSPPEKTSTPDHPLPGERQLFYFSGCYANFFEPTVAKATIRLAAASGLSPLRPEGQGCCGLAAYSAGELAMARRLARANLTVFGDGDQPILTSCASCFSHLKTYPELLAGDPPAWRERAERFSARVVEFSSFLLSRLPAPRHPSRSRPGTAGRVFYHDPCHLRFGHRLTIPPRELLRRATDLEPVELDDEGGCCGHGGLFSLAHPDLSRTILDRLLNRVLPLEPALVTSTCTGCLLQWRQGLTARKSSIRVRHLALLLRDAAD